MTDGEHNEDRPGYAPRQDDTGTMVATALFIGILVLAVLTSVIAVKWFFGQGDRTLTSPEVNEILIFSSADRRVASADFRGGRIVTVFGSGTIDLRQAQVADGTTLEVTTVFGNTHVRVPEDWQVETEGTAVFGRVHDRTAGAAGGEEDLTISGTAIFGQIEVSH